VGKDVPFVVKGLPFVGKDVPFVVKGVPFVGKDIPFVVNLGSIREYSLNCVTGENP